MKIASYLRFSSEKQTGNLSLDLQREENRRFVERTFPGAETVEITDEAETGTSFDRQGIHTLKDMARAGLMEAVVVYKYDRFGRNVLEALLNLRDLEQECGIAVYSATEPNEPIVRNLMLTMAEEFSRQLGERCKGALDETTKRGFAANKAPYGYRLLRVPDPAGGKPKATFEIVEEEATVVRRIFAMRVEGRSYMAIAHALNSESVPSPRGGTWDVTAIRHILFNERYLGHAITGQRARKKGGTGRSGKVRRRPREEWVVHANAHPAIIDEAAWQLVHTKDRSRKGPPLTRLQRRHPLAGLVRCAECGGNYVARVTGSGNQKLAYYECAMRLRRGETVCGNGTRVREDRLLDHIFQEASEKLTEEAFVSSVAEGAWEALEELSRGRETPEALEARIEAIGRKIERAGARMLGLPEEAVDGLRKEIARLSQERGNLRQRLEALRASRPATLSRKALAARVREEIQNSVGPLIQEGPEAVQKAAQALVSEIEVFSDGEVRTHLNPAAALAAAHAGISQIVVTPTGFEPVLPG